MDRFPNVETDRIHSRMLVKDGQWKKIVSTPAILDLAEMFLGPNLVHYYSRFFIKRPGTGQATLWHQDGTYYTLSSPSALVSLWISLTDSDRENGCLRVFPKSHLGETLPIRESKGTLLSRSLDPSLLQEDLAVDVPTRAGDIVAIHPNLVHGSHANQSERLRVGLAIRYIPPSNRITWEDTTAEPWDCAMLLRGSDPFGLNRYVGGGTVGRV